MSDEKIINYDPSNEQLLLSNACQSRAYRKKLLNYLTEVNFIGSRHKTIFKTLKRLENEGLDYNEDTFNQYATDDDYGGIKYLRKIIDAYEINPNIDRHIELQIELSTKYKIQTHWLEKISEDLNNPNVNLLDLKTKLQIIQNEINHSGFENQIVKGKEAKNDYFKALKERSDRDGFVGFGIENVDEHLVEGVAKKKVIIIAARPSMGKTTYVANSIEEWRKQKKKVLVAALESGREAIIDAMVAKKLKIHLSELVRYTKDLSSEKKLKIRDYLNEVFKDEYIQFWKDENPLTLDKIIQVCAEGGYDICVIDLFEKLQDVITEGSGRNIDGKLDQLQNGAKIANVSMVITSQIKRLQSAKNQRNPRPTLEDIKNAGRYEEIADLIILLHRAHYYDKNTRDVLEQIIAKQRRGGRMISAFNDFIGQYATVGDQTTDPEEDDEGFGEFDESV